MSTPPVRRFASLARADADRQTQLDGVPRDVSGASGKAVDPLMTSVYVKKLRMKNRILSTAHAPNFVQDKLPQERYQAYHEEKAKGGLAMTMFGGSSTVSLDSPSAFGQICVADDVVIPHFQKFASRIHAHDCHLICQLSHMGRRTLWDAEDWHPVVAPSRVREVAHRAFPKELERSDIKRIVADFAAAARRCYAGGLDGVELLASGHLIDQFWSPISNRRTDAYGGAALQDRMRFSVEVLEAIRAVVADENFVVGIRMTMEEHDGSKDAVKGLSRDDCFEIAHHLTCGRHAGLVDFLNLNRGLIHTDRSLASHIPGMRLDRPYAPYLELAGEFRRGLGGKVPIFHACRLDVSSARRAVKEGLVDMVGMTRPHLADPHLVNKLARGEEDRIRPCVGAGVCLDRIYVGLDAVCLYNPATGREHLGFPQVITPREDGKRLRVVVVGGGPAGLEAARVSGLRGHEVVLLEAQKELGGQVMLAAKAGWRRDLIGITRWLEAEVERLPNTTVLRNNIVSPDEVLRHNPDVVVVAMGGLPYLMGLEGVETAWSILSG